MTTSRQATGCAAALPRWARITIASACFTIGVASSAVAGWLLVRGLELTEPDDKARMILTAAGILMVMTELTAFFITALLPAARLYRLRAIGAALLVFEIATIYGTRLVLNSGAESMAAARATRIEGLQRSIETRSADAARIRAGGERQAASEHTWARYQGVQMIQKADALGREIEPMREALADLQSQQHDTLQNALGPGLARAHSIAMPILISSTGLVLFSVAGLMLRRNVPATVPTDPVPADPVPATVPTDPVPTDPVPATVPAIVPTDPVPTDPVPAVDDGYPALRNAVLAGGIKPSVRTLRDARYGGTDTVRRLLQRLAADGIITKSGQGYVVVTQQHGERA